MASDDDDFEDESERRYASRRRDRTPSARDLGDCYVTSAAQCSEVHGSNQRRSGAGKSDSPGDRAERNRSGGHSPANAPRRLRRSSRRGLPALPATAVEAEPFVPVVKTAAAAAAASPARRPIGQAASRRRREESTPPRTTKSTSSRPTDNSKKSSDSRDVVRSDSDDDFEEPVKRGLKSAKSRAANTPKAISASPDVVMSNSDDEFEGPVEPGRASTVLIAAESLGANDGGTVDVEMADPEKFSQSPTAPSRAAIQMCLKPVKVSSICSLQHLALRNPHASDLHRTRRRSEMGNARRWFRVGNGWHRRETIL